MNNCKEIWKDIEGFEGLYQVSNLGNVKSLGNRSNHKKDILMKKVTDKKGYENIALCKNSISKRYKIHRLVALTFIENKNNLPQVNHKNGIKNDNRVVNLEWCNNSENQLHANKNGLCKNRIKQVKLSCSKEITQYELNGKVIKKYKSLKEASRQTGINNKAISLAALGKTKTSGGYKWEYTLDENRIDLFVSSKEHFIDRGYKGINPVEIFY